MEIRQRGKEFSIDMEKMRNFIKDKDVEKITLHIEDIYQRLKFYNGLTPTFLKSTTTQIIFIILNTVSMTSSYSSSFFDYTDSMLLRASEMKSLQEHCEWVKDVANNAVAYLLSADRNYSPVIKNVIKYINNNFNKEIALKSISGSLNMNTVYLGHLFKIETGEMFSCYLNRIRIDEAKKLLLATNLNTMDIGIKVGYSNNNHFFATFKKNVGLNPAEYRRINKISAI